MKNRGIRAAHMRWRGLAIAGQGILDLFAVIGTRWNTGGETGTQFRLPSLSGKVIRA